MSRFGLAVLLSASVLSFSASAGDEAAVSGCQSKSADICSRGVPRVATATGDVLLSRGSSFAEVGSGTSLSAGDRILVKNGKAKLSLGPSCQADLGPNSMVTISQKDGVTCASRVSADPRTAGQGATNNGGPNFEVIVPVVVVGGAIAGLAALTDNDGSGAPIVVNQCVSPPGPCP